MNQGDLVLIRGGLGYRPAMVKNIGKRKTEVIYTDEKTEWIENKRITFPDCLRDKAFIERLLREEKYFINK